MYFLDSRKRCKLRTTGSNPGPTEPNEDWQHCQVHKRFARALNGSTVNLQRLASPKAGAHSQAWGSVSVFLQYFNLVAPLEMHRIDNAVKGSNVPLLYQSTAGLSTQPEHLTSPNCVTCQQSSPESSPYSHCAQQGFRCSPRKGHIICGKMSNSDVAENSTASFRVCVCAHWLAGRWQEEQRGLS